MTERRPSPLVAAFGGALLGVLIATMAKGAVMGWDGGRGEWAWLNALFGMLGGPMLLALDYLAISGKGPPGSELVALPWAGIGAALGAIAGVLSNKDH
jgi:hypothetical protein